MLLFGCVNIGNIYSVTQPAGQQRPDFFAFWRFYVMFLVTASSLENFRDGAENLKSCHSLKQLLTVSKEIAIIILCISDL